MTIQSNTALSARTVHRTVLFVLLAGLLSMLIATPLEARMKRDTLTLKTASGAHKIDIEVAQTAEDKALGLMFRTSLAPNAGMLFPYTPPQEATMWMRNTFISLDMVFIRADGTVHRIEFGTEPHSERIIASQGDVSAVLELAAGVAQKLQLKPGDRVEHPLFKGSKL